MKPQLMQMTDHVSYVVTDPKGTIIVECGRMLVNHGYQIKVLNTINFSKSMHFNPFHYIRSEKDVLKLVNTIIANTKGEGEKATEDFWVKAERLLYTALIGYIWYEAPEEEQNFSTLLEFINASETREEDEDFKNAVDELFEELEAENPEHFAVRQYRKYKLAAGKTAKSILISCGARLAPFDIAELRELTSYDELNWTSWETERPPCLSLFLTRMIPLILLWQSCTHSFLICCVAKRMMFTGAGFLIMYGFCWMSSAISGRFLNLTSLLLRSEAGKSLHQLSSSHRVS